MQLKSRFFLLLCIFHFQLAATSIVTLEQERRRAEKSDPQALVNLGILHLDGIGVEKNQETAEEFFTRASLSNRGHPIAQHLLANILLKKLDTTDLLNSNYRIYMYWLLRSAKQNYLPAQIQVGKSYLDANKYKKARYWLERTKLTQTDATALYLLGVTYEQGKEELGKDYQKQAFQAYTSSAAQGYPLAQYKLSLMYLQEGLQDEAQKFLEKAAVREHAKSQLLLAKILLSKQGKQVGKDVLFWAEKAAQSLNEARFFLGSLYLSADLKISNAEQRDLDKLAFHWLRLAALRGHAQAQFLLGALYAEGRGGVNKSPMQAIYWYSQAVENGYTKAQEILEITKNLAAKEAAADMENMSQNCHRNFLN